jgi:lysophospholipase L1-like esterase
MTPTRSFQNVLRCVVVVTMLSTRMAFGQVAMISQANWTLHATDSQETSVNNLASNAFDGNPASYWATQWATLSPSHPHELMVNLNATYTISGFRYLPRQDDEFGRIGNFEFYVSTDGVNWGTAAAAGTFPNTAAEQQILFTPRAGRFVRLRALSEVVGTGHPWTTVAELNVLGTGNQPPNGVITGPLGDVFIMPGQSVTFTGSGNDPDNTGALTYSWSFGVGGPPGSSSPNPAPITFPGTGTYLVTFTVRDGLSVPDPSPATRAVIVQPGTPVGLLSQAGWSLHFVDSEETNTGDYLAVNAFDGNPNTVWTTQWFNGGPPPPHEIQIDLGASHSIAGFRYLPHQDWQPGRIGEYEFYVSADGDNWGLPAAVGAFPDSNVSTARDVLFTPRTGRYVRLRALTEVNNGFVLTAIAELNIWLAGAGTNQPPTASIATPAQDLSVIAGSSIPLTGTANDFDGHLPLTYRWSFGAGSGVADQLVLSPGLVHFDRSGVFPITFNVTDALGRTTTATRVVTVVGGQAIPTAGWTVPFVDSQEAGFEAANAFDGNPGTFWGTEWTGAQPPPPHEIQIDLGANRDIVGFRYLPRQDGSTVGNIAHYQFYVSADGANWGAPTAAGTFAPDSSVKEVTFGLRTGRYVRLRALSEVNGLPFAVAAEIQVLQRQCLAAPSVRLATPRSGYLQSSASLTLAADACISQPGLGVAFIVNGSPVAYDFVPPFQITLPAGFGDYTIEAALVNGAGNQIAGDATRDRSTPVGIGDYYVAMGDGITRGNGDDQPSDDNSADGRSLLGGYTSILADALTTHNGYPVTIVNAGINGATSETGAADIARQLQNEPHANYFLLVYGHNDARAARPSGLGLTPDSPDYLGSYKDYMQRIITAVHAAGKFVFLAKPGAVLPIGGTDDNRVQEYGFVIDELAASNGITVTPDFYTYFAGRASTHFSTSTEPNGLGYQGMALLWFFAIHPLHFSP